MGSFFLGGFMVLASIAIGIYAGLYLGLYKGIVKVVGLFRRDPAVVRSNEDIAKAFIFTWLRIFLGVNGGIFIMIILGLPGVMMMVHALFFEDAVSITIPNLKKASGKLTGIDKGPSKRNFTDNGNGTVTDKVTGLMWQQEDDDVVRNWTDANSYCSGLSLAGHTGWRLPTWEELFSIVDQTVQRPTIDKSKFPNTKSSNYWSSSTYSTGKAYYVSFKVGDYSDYNMAINYYVRCVRGRQ